MNMTKSVFDVSPFLLFEASADSEAGHDGVDDDQCVNDYDGDDDMDESCSASSCETSCVTWTSQRPSGLLGVDHAEETVEKERDVAGEEEEDDNGEGEVNSYRRCKRENLAVEMSEMDKSRLFWEACLAS
ncbi:hypothetical protein AALP_AA4G271100 [Arabis alpina]|uniref:Uncharacterized protein n=1 Tax=Arabis alpina TaxID=50452 RepID=A0A087H5Z7_ARAAL|nr:hypothetical protein AALP_AA4G271100 [Arabis alpina]